MKFKKQSQQMPLLNQLKKLKLLSLRSSVSQVRRKKILRFLILQPRQLSLLQNRSLLYLRLLLCLIRKMSLKISPDLFRLRPEISMLLRQKEIISKSLITKTESFMIQKWIKESKSIISNKMVIISNHDKETAMVEMVSNSNHEEEAAMVECVVVTTRQVIDQIMLSKMAFLASHI